MARRSVVATVSILVHAFVLVALATMDLWRPITEWPRPREAWAFEPAAVHVDVQLPPEPRRTSAVPSTAPTGPARPSELAPIAPPPDVAPEGEHQALRSLSPGDPGPIDKLFGGPEGGVAPAPPPIISTPSPQKLTPLRPSSGIKPPQRLVNVAPVYPATAIAARKEGVVIIDATIDEQGNVTETRILRSIPLLDEAAVAAVRRWKFSPTLLNGVPVPIVMTVTVNFMLTQ
jgi:protein TonB